MIEHYRDSNTEDIPLFIVRSKQARDFTQEMSQVLEILSKGSTEKNVQVLDYLDEEKSNSNQISNLLEQINYALRPDEIRTIFIGWNDKIQKTGNFNKLLKVFEQPPRRNWIFLCVPKNDKLPQTILSRGIEILEDDENGMRAKESNTFEEVVHHVEDEEVKELASHLLSYVNGQQGIAEISQKLRAAPDKAENVLRIVLNHLSNGLGPQSKYMILSKIITKYGKSKEINLNKFDNILIPLKFLLVNERK